MRGRESGRTRGRRERARETKLELTNPVGVQLITSPPIYRRILSFGISFPDVEVPVGDHPDGEPSNLLLNGMDHIWMFLSEQRLGLDPRFELGHLNDRDSDGLGQTFEIEYCVEGDGGRDVGVVVDVAEVKGGREGEEDGDSSGEEGEVDGCNERKREGRVSFKGREGGGGGKERCAPFAPIITSLAEGSKKREGGGR